MDTMLNSLDSSSNKVYGQNGHSMYNEKSVDSLLVLYNKLCRGVSRDVLISLINNACKAINCLSNVDDLNQLKNVVVLCFQTRDIDNGKGEKTLAHWFLIELYYKKLLV